MFNSVRTKLTLWYSAVLALTLISFAVFTYFFLSRAVELRTDRSLTEIAAAFETNAQSELTDLVRQEADNEQGKPLSPEFYEKAALQETVNDLNFRDYRIFVFDKNRQIIAQSIFAANSDADEKALLEVLQNELPNLIEQPANLQSKPAFFTFPMAGGEWRVASQDFSINNRAISLAVARRLTEDDKLRREIAAIFAFAIPFALIAASAGGYFLARKALMPIAAMSRQAAFINHENLHERLPVGNELDELGSLAKTFNALLARLDASFANQRRFIADASHELRTPIAIVRGESEIALSRDMRPAADYRESLEIVWDESRRMSRIVEDLFALARVDAGQLPVAKNELRLDKLLIDAVRAVRMLAEKGEIELKACVENDMVIFGDAALLRRMFLNLLDNAIKYTGRNGTIEVKAACENAIYVVRISDSGAGIPLAAQPHIFERFFRADNVRARAQTAEGSGVGLGLSIAGWIAEAHAIRLELESSDEKGTTFAVKIPVET